MFSITTKTLQNNLTNNERNILISFKNNSKIVIKNADKSNTIVIIDKNQYISKAKRDYSHSNKLKTGLTRLARTNS